MYPMWSEMLKNIFSNILDQYETPIYKWLTCNFSLWHPHIIQHTCNENTQTYQLEVSSLDLTPNSPNLFTWKCVAARGEN